MRKMLAEDIGFEGRFSDIRWIETREMHAEDIGLTFRDLYRLLGRERLLDGFVACRTEAIR